MDSTEGCHIDLGLFRLPAEILENVFADSCIAAEDLASLCKTCSYFRKIISNDFLWKSKFKQRWPEVFQEMEAMRVGDGGKAALCWKTLYQQRFFTKKVVAGQLRKLVQETRKGELKYQKAADEGPLYDFSEMLPSEVETGLRSVFVIDEVQEIIKRDHPWHNLTGKYFAEKALWYLHHKKLTPIVEKFMETPEHERDVEVGAILIAQWFQPHKVIRVQDIKKQFDNIADSVKDALRTINAEHPLVSGSAVVVPDNIAKSMWDSGKCKQILQAIEMVIKPAYNKDFETYYTPSNSFINVVLKTQRGIPITLCLVVMSVARRLGMILEPVNFPHHFILRWMEHPSKSDVYRYSFVDVYSGNYFLSYQDLSDTFFTGSVEASFCEKCSHMDILHRIMRNLLHLGKNQRGDGGLDLLRFTVELANHFMPNNVELVIVMAQVALHMKVNMRKAISKLQETTAAVAANDQMGILLDLQLQCQKLLVHLQESADIAGINAHEKRRRDYPKVKYAVGMVMQHKKYHYYCVIRGWDEKCAASEQWIRQMRVDKCQRGRYQPFYNVWVSDGSDRYAAEENLMFTKETEGKLITHPKVGRLFQSFNGRHYVPGPHLQVSYPDDLPVTEAMVNNFFEQEQHGEASGEGI